VAPYKAEVMFNTEMFGQASSLSKACEAAFDELMGISVFANNSKSSAPASTTPASTTTTPTPPASTTPASTKTTPTPPAAPENDDENNIEITNEEYSYYKEKVVLDNLLRELSALKEQLDTFNSKNNKPGILGMDSSKFAEQGALITSVQTKQNEVNAQKIKLEKLETTIRNNVAARGEEVPYLMTKAEDAKYPKYAKEHDKIKNKIDKLYLQKANAKDGKKQKIQTKIEEQERLLAENDYIKLEMEFATAKYDLVKMQEELKDLGYALNYANSNDKQSITKEIKEKRTQISNQKEKLENMQKELNKD